MKERFLKLSAYVRMKMYEWTELVFALDSFKTRLVFQEKEIWDCHIGLNIGDEQRGEGEDFLRPVIILKKFNERLCWVIPLTRTIKNSPYYFIFIFIGETPSAAIITQLCLIDTMRLHTRIGKIHDNDFIKIKKKLITLLS